MRADSIIKVSKALGVSTDFLLTGVVTDFERTRLTRMLEPLDETQLHVVEEIVKNILRFGGYTIKRGRLCWKWFELVFHSCKGNLIGKVFLGFFT